MSEQQKTYEDPASSTRDIVGDVYALLESLSAKRNIEPLKELFWHQLSYTRQNKTLPRSLLPASSADLLLEDPLLLASGGAGENFIVISLRLASSQLSHRDERVIVSQLLNRYPDGLYVFSNRGRDTWHFLNVKPDVTNSKRRLFRRITIGPEERLRTASERIAMLDLTSLPEVSRLDILALHEEAFDVEAVTRKFYDDYRVLFQILQKDLTQQTGDATWAHDYALQFLNRCMFLYFIQRKGWLGSDREFLKTFWQSYRNREHKPDTFFTNWLSILFFEAFNNQFYHGYTHFPHKFTLSWQGLLTSMVDSSRVVNWIP